MYAKRRKTRKVFHVSQAAAGEADDFIDSLTMKKTWEMSNYPYLFFNEDGESFSTLGFYARRGEFAPS